MSQKDRELLLKDLCARLLYEVICLVTFKDSEGWKTKDMILKGIINKEGYFVTDGGSTYSTEFKPYLRPMSSMTEEERKEYKHLVTFSGSPDGSENFVEWLNKKMFAYRTVDGKDMFKLDLALKAPEGMYQKNEELIST